MTDTPTTKLNEIVGAFINRKTITNKTSDIAAALDMGMDIEWLSRARMEFMANCDLGQRWDAMAAGPTLFCIVDGKLCDAEGNEVTK